MKTLQKAFNNGMDVGNVWKAHLLAFHDNGDKITSMIVVVCNGWHPKVNAMANNLLSGVLTNRNTSHPQYHYNGMIVSYNFEKKKPHRENIEAFKTFVRKKLSNTMLDKTIFPLLDDTK